VTDLDLDAIKARADAATPGPWYRVGPPWNRGAPWVNAGSEDPHHGRFLCDLDAEMAGVDRDDDEPSNEVADAEFIAHARTDVPALLARIAELEAERDQWLPLRQAVERVATERGGLPFDFSPDEYADYARTLFDLSRQDAERRGYERAVARLRDDALYQEWNRQCGLDPAGPRSYVPAEHRDVMHDYIEWAANLDAVKESNDG